MTTLEIANIKDAERCYGILDQGRAFQREQGFVQWGDVYPSLDTVTGDILAGKGYTMNVDGDIAGYMCIDFDGEPAYNDIKGEWKTSENYVVVHRMAFDKKYRGIGLADTTFRLIDEFCLSRGVHAIRVDTDEKNKRMQHIFKKNGYEYRGTVFFVDSDKMAFDKSI